MKRTINAIALMAASIACAVPAPYPVTVNSRAQTAPPVVAYAGNETVYRVSFTDGDTASAIVAGEVPFFAWATNNAASVNSTSTYAIVAGTTGVVDFTFSPSAINFAPGRYIYETGVRGSNGNTRVYRQGTFQIYGSPVGSGVAAVSWTTNMNWSAINWQNLPAWLSTPAVTPAQTNGWVVTSHDGFITTNDADRIVFNALSTNRVTRWYDPELPTRWAEWDGGTNIVIYRAEVIGTNFVVTSDGPLMDITVEPPDYRIYTEQVFPFTDLAWTGTMSEGSPATLTITATDSAVWSVTTSTFPAVLLPQNAYSIGTATVSVASYSYTTNVEWRYYLPTNAIPYEFQNIDYLQGWLNNLYAGKSVVDGHITGGTHTNVTLAGTVTIGGVARTDWPEGGSASPASVAALITASPTNITVISTQQVYEVTTTGAGAVGINWSGVSLTGKRAEILLRLHVSEWGGTNVTFSPSLTFDQTPKILVTGVWEFACSTVDGVTTRVSQTWPEATSYWMPAHYAAGSAQGWGAATNYAIDFQMPMGCGLVIYRVRARVDLGTSVTATIGYSSMESLTGAMVQTVYPQYLFDDKQKWYVLAIPFTDYTPPYNNATQGAVMRIAKYGEGQTATTTFTVYFRTSNANERAAYAAGWRP